MTTDLTAECAECGAPANQYAHDAHDDQPQPFSAPLGWEDHMTAFGYAPAPGSQPAQDSSEGEQER